MPMTSTELISGRPVAPPTLDSQPFWDATRENELRIQRCGKCGQFTFFPRVRCPNCGSDDLGWTRAAGTGAIWSFTVVERAVSAACRDVVPYVVALVALAEGPMMMTNIIDCDPGSVSIGMSVEVVFHPVDDGRAVPLFRPVGSNA